MTEMELDKMITEAAEYAEKRLEELGVEELIPDMENNGFEIFTVEDLEKMGWKYFESKADYYSEMNKMYGEGLRYFITLPGTGAWWYAKSIADMVLFFDAGNKLDVKNCGYVITRP